MLSKNDLQQIRDVVREEIEVETKPMRGEIKFSTLKLESRIHETQNKMKDVTIKLDKMDRNIKKIRSEVRFIREALNATIKHFEQEDVQINSRIGRIEDHVGLENP